MIQPQLGTNAHHFYIVAKLRCRDCLLSFFESHTSRCMSGNSFRNPQSSWWCCDHLLTDQGRQSIDWDTSFLRTLSIRDLHSFVWTSLLHWSLNFWSEHATRVSTSWRILLWYYVLCVCLFILYLTRNESLSCLRSWESNLWRLTKRASPWGTLYMIQSDVKVLFLYRQYIIHNLTSSLTGWTSADTIWSRPVSSLWADQLLLS